MKIVHLGKYYPPAAGGIETHTQALARAQSQLGCDVTVVVVNHESSRKLGSLQGLASRNETKEAFDGRVRVVRVGRLGQLSKFDITTSLRPILSRLHSEGQDIWHLHTPNVSMLLAAACMRRIHPLVVTHHSDIVRQQILKSLYHPIESRVYSRADLILSDSPPYIEGSRVLQQHREKVKTLPLGVDLRPFVCPTPEALAFAETLRSAHSHPLWLSVGRLIYYKGLHIAIEALKDVPGKLLIIGTGPEEASLRALAERFTVADRVVWLGAASPDELIGAYHAATALWFPSNARSEGFGLVQVEAMACGCPVINTQIPNSGVAWVSEHETTGLTVPVNDSRALAAAANRLLRSPESILSFSMNARRSAARRFDHMTMADSSLDFYHTAIRYSLRRNGDRPGIAQQDGSTASSGTAIP